MSDAVVAVVRAGDVETTYVRAGQGRPVLLLVEGTPASIARGALFLRLAATARVVAPAPVPDAVVGRGGGAAVPVGIWLRDLLEGLGLHCPSLVADVAFAAMLEPWMAPECEGLARTVFVHPGSGNAALDELIARLGRGGAAPGHP